VVDPVPWRTAGPLRRNLLIAHLGALDARLRALGGGLHVATGDPVALVPEVARWVGAREVHLNADVSAYAQRRDARVAESLGGIAVRSHWGNLVHAPGTVTAASTGRVQQVFTPFFRAWGAATRAPWPEPTGRPARLLPPPAGAEPVPAADGEPVMPGGEDAAAGRLAAWIDHVDGYEERRNTPGDPEGTSHLSADLRFGTLSPRHVIDAVGTHTPGRAAFVRQLAWRDWYAHLLAGHPALSRRAMRPEMDRVAWRHDPAGLAAWAEGRTGYPIVDAGMRELAATGWMHNRVRMVTASFLTKDLLVDWRHGEAHFRRHLVDFEVSQNAGNWQWVAGTGPDASPYFRVFNPVTQGRRFDPEGDYVRHWVPELAGLAGASVHAPWELGPLELAAAGITLGEGYPLPLVQHAAARDRAVAAYEAARAGR